MEHFVYLIVIGLVALFRILAESSAKAKRREQANQQGRPAKSGQESEVERQRRFLQAAGLPAGSQLPTPVKPRADTVTTPLQPVVFSTTPPGRVRRIQTGMPTKSATPSPLMRPVYPTPPPQVLAPVSSETAQFPQSVPPPPSPFATVAAEVQNPTLAVPTLPSAIPGQAAAVSAQPASAPQPDVSTFLALLRNPSSIRQAIILREVLGPPRALQDSMYSGAGQWATL